MAIPRFRRHHLSTPDLSSAREFYRQLFGWSFSGDEEGVVVVHAAEREIGTMKKGPESDTPRWVGAVGVPDAEATARAAEEAGAGVERGEPTVIRDPQGAFVAVFTPDEEDEPAPTTGMFSWNEVFSTDPDGTAAFYRTLFGWRVRRIEFGEAGGYLIFTNADEEVEPAGIVHIPEDTPHPPHWLPYVLVEDVDATSKRVSELGGWLLLPPAVVPHVGRFSVCGDPGGALFALFRKETEEEAAARLANQRGFRGTGEATA